MYVYCLDPGSSPEPGYPVAFCGLDQCFQANQATTDTFHVIRSSRQTHYNIKEYVALKNLDFFPKYFQAMYNCYNKYTLFPKIHLSRLYFCHSVDVQNLIDCTCLRQTNMLYFC